LEIKKWNEIQERFTDSFGWERGIELMISVSGQMTQSKAVYELSLSEDTKLIKQLRQTYNKELKWQEKENHK
jgi:hypothetical protein